MASIAPFLFGKLPAHGDFVSRGLADSERAAWDRWASEAMERLGGDDPAHGEIPPWRFIAGPSALGPGWRVGALAPSIDRAERRFVAVLGLGGLSAKAAAGVGLAAASEIEDLLYRAIGERLTAEEAAEALDGYARALADDLARAEALEGGPAAEDRWWIEGDPASRRTGALPPADLLAAVRPEALHAG
jgi:type VI secretion system ImpM family protein